MADNHRSDILFATAVVLLLAVAWQIRDVLLLIYVSALFAVVIGPTVDVIRKAHIGKWHAGRGLAVLILIVGIAFLFSLLAIFIAPPIYRDLHSFSQDLPSRAHQLVERIKSLPFGDRVNIASIQEHAAEVVGGAFGIFGKVAGGVFGLFSWLLLTAYFIVDGERAVRWGLSLFPAKSQPRLRSTLERAESRVSRWLLGQLMLMLILGVTSSIVFALLHVKYPLALGVLCGIANIVPIAGPILSVGLATIVAAFDSWNKAAGVLIFYLVYQQVENAFLTPKIMKSTVDLPALAVIIALTIGGALVGIVGALVAVPTAALVAVLIDEYVVKENSAASMNG